VHEHIKPLKVITVVDSNDILGNYYSDDSRRTVQPMPLNSINTQ